MNGAGAGLPGDGDALAPAAVARAQLPDLGAVVEGLRRAWQECLLAAAKDRSDAERRLAAAGAEARQRASRFVPEQQLLDRYARAWQLYGSGGVPAEADAPVTVDDAAESWQAAVRRCEGSLLSFRQRRAEAEAARRKAFSRNAGGPVLPARFAGDLAVLRAVLEAVPALQASEIRVAGEHARRAAAADSARGLREREASLADAAERADAAFSRGLALAGPAALGWEEFLACAEQAPRSEGTMRWLRLGAYDLATPSRAVQEVPCLLDFPFTRALAIRTRAGHEAEALALARSVILRAFFSIPAGRLALSVIDPLAMGGSLADFLHLGHRAPRLVDPRPRTSAREIDAKLSELCTHLEVVISRHLRRQYASITEYNDAVGDPAEPYELLTVLGFPAQFTDSALHQFASLIQNGPRCGLLPLLLLGEEDDRASHDLLAAMDIVTFTGDGRIRLERASGNVSPDAIPDEWISYARADAPQVDRLQSALEEAGVAVWRDTASLWPGDDWASKIRTAITKDALVFISCFSRASLARPVAYQNEELTLAIEQLRMRSLDQTWFIPVRLDDCEIPDRPIGGGSTLSSIQRCDLFGERRTSEIQRLIEVVLRTLDAR